MRMAFLGLCVLLGCGGRIEGEGNNGNGNGNGSGGGSGSGGAGGGGSGSGFVCDGRLAFAKQPRKIASDGSFVYFTTWGDPNTQKNGSVWRVSVKGGAPEKLADDPELTDDIVVDDAHVYWVGYPTHLASIPKGGGVTTILATGDVSRVALDAGFVYLSRGDRITRVDKATHVESTVTTGDGIDAIAVADRLWFVERGNGSLHWAPKTGGDAHAVASPDLESVYDLAADGDGVFGVSTDAGVAWRATESGFTVRASGFQCPANVAARAGTLYFGNVAIACANDLDDSKRGVVRLSGSTTKVVGHAMIEGISGIAVDDASVYWTGGDGIYCAPR